MGSTRHCDEITTLMLGQTVVIIAGSTATVQFRGADVARVSLLAACHADDQEEALSDVSPVNVEFKDGRYTVELSSRSSLWKRKTYHFSCTEHRLEYWFTVEGTGNIFDCAFFRGRPGDEELPEGGAKAASALPKAFFPSYFNPEPNACRKHYFSTDEYSTIGVRSDKSYYRGNWFFTPGPYCYVLKVNDGAWMTAGLVVPPGQNDFVEYEFQGGDALGLRVRYEGNLSVDGVWESPHVVFLTGKDEYSALTRYSDYLRQLGYAPRPHKLAFDWWREPIFCGWGEQCWLAAADGRARMGPEYATQANYEQFVTQLVERGLRPGTLIIDDKWQLTYGDPCPDPCKWPDLAGFISKQHQAGRRVLLWLKAWDCEGVPASECMLDHTGQAVAVDPTNADYEKRLRRRIRELISVYGADGFKLDFTHILPRNISRKPGQVWGIELLHRLLEIIYAEAKATKEDALIIGHSINPYFIDVIDMARLNDVVFIPGRPELDDYVDSMLVRQKVVRAVSGDWLIDADNWPSPNRAAWLDYVHKQPEVGVPSLYYITHVDESGEEIRPEDIAAVTDAWNRYKRLVGKS
jgi:hypothetical protein